MNPNNPCLLELASEFCAIMDAFDAIINLRHQGTGLTERQKANLDAVLADLGDHQAAVIQRMAKPETAQEVGYGKH